VSLANTTTGFRWAEPLGVYEAVAESLGVRVEVARDSELQGYEVPKGTFIEVIDVQCTRTGKEQRARGNLRSGGWITLSDIPSGSRFANPVPLGRWETIPAGTDLTIEEDLDSGVMGPALPPRAVVTVAEVRCVDNNRHIRGRLASGGWVSLVDKEQGTLWAQPVETRPRAVKAPASSPRHAAPMRRGGRGRDRGRPAPPPEYACNHRRSETIAGWNKRLANRGEFSRTN
jgi:hypothetical protein